MYGLAGKFHTSTFCGLGLQRKNPLGRLLGVGVTLGRTAILCSDYLAEYFTASSRYRVVYQITAFEGICLSRGMATGYNGKL